MDYHRNSHSLSRTYTDIFIYSEIILVPDTFPLISCDFNSCNISDFAFKNSVRINDGMHILHPTIFQFMFPRIPNKNTN